MEENTSDIRLYAINKETGEKYEIGRRIPETPKLALGGFVDCEMPIESLGENLEAEITVKLKTITKKTIH